ncbi:hypothetical protein X474_07105 [Dethiosulfatarculus sandiegensis]|uniref:HTH gntR-type domain-containing protein n=1 Tax=Dethiosulfatarculus sandiegensis TaxID=1429043 RepID=A0A0D2J9S9_9BACT|nr:hypothetical protein X474_07105 [Dethiosulfatarculus sandiegensis]
MKKPSLTERAYEEIKKRIIHFQLKPGTRLKLDELAQALGMSQTPIREALNKLEQEQLVERPAKKGFTVKALTIQEIEDIYDFRIALEVLAAEQAARRITSKDLDKLETIQRRIPQKQAQGEKNEVLRLSQEFHAVIMNASGNQLLAETGQRLLERIWMLQNINLLTSDHLTDAHREHSTIVEALRKRDPEKVSTLMRQHLILAKKFIVARLNNQDDFLSTFIYGSDFGTI